MSCSIKKDESCRRPRVYWHIAGTKPARGTFSGASINAIKNSMCLTYQYVDNLKNNPQKEKYVVSVHCPVNLPSIKQLPLFRKQCRWLWSILLWWPLDGMKALTDSTRTSSVCTGLQLHPLSHCEQQHYCSPPLCTRSSAYPAAHKLHLLKSTDMLQLDKDACSVHGLKVQISDSCSC